MALASILHDIGCIAGREKHGETTVKMLKTKHFDFLINEIQPMRMRALEQVIKAHSRSFDFKKVGPDPSNEIRLKLICPIFRLADACDLSGERIKRLVMEILIDAKTLKGKSRKIWEAHMNIENVLVEKTVIKPLVYDLNGAKYCLDSLKAELKPINDFLKSQRFAIFSLEPTIVPR